jgi:4-diphosphocytidyl-2-C-methyl-D-erythritol kinase
MVAFPPCKINLGLQVLRRRADGYHDIETCFYPVPRTDVLEIVPAREFRFEQTGISIPGSIEDNLCVKAYRLLQKDYDLGAVEIYLHKLIPAGSGLGGGSSDGTWTLRLLNSVFNLSISDSKMADYAVRLGSDCPFFLHDAPMIGTARGEQLSPTKVSLKGKYLVIVRPDVHVSTRTAYEAVTPGLQKENIKSIVESIPVNQWQGRLVNQFEPVVMSNHPVIGQIRDNLYRAGAVFAGMSGSGSAVFGLFEAQKDLSNNFTDMDYWSGWLTV